MKQPVTLLLAVSLGLSYGFSDLKSYLIWNYDPVEKNLISLAHQWSTFLWGQCSALSRAKIKIKEEFHLGFEPGSLGSNAWLLKPIQLPVDDKSVKFFSDKIIWVIKDKMQPFKKHQRHVSQNFFSVTFQFGSVLNPLSF